MAHLAGAASDTTEVIGVLGGSVIFRSHSKDRNPALWSFGNDPIVTVEFKDPPRLVFHKPEFETLFAVSENGRALIISQLRMEDAGTYSVKINGETSTFTLQVYGELEEPTVTCKAQNCSDGSCPQHLLCSSPSTDLGNGSCTWNKGDRLLAEGCVLPLNGSSWVGPEPLTCTVRNPVSIRNITVTTPRALCKENSMDSLSPGAHSSSIIGGIGGMLLLAVLIRLMFHWKSKVLNWMKRLRGRAVSQRDSHGAAGDQVMDNESQAEESV